MRKSKAWRWIGIVALAIVLTVALATAWIFSTPSGTRWAVARVASVLGDAFKYQNVRGTLAGPLTVTNLRYVSPDGLKLSARELAADVQWRSIFRRAIHVRFGQVNGASLTLPSQPSEPEKSNQFSFEPPIDIEVDRFALSDLVVYRDATAILDVMRADLAGSWTHAGMAIDRLDLISSQGQLSASGKVRHSGDYVGGAHLGFRWRAGQQTYAGRVAMDAKNHRITLGARMSEPSLALVDVSLEQEATLPWTVQLTVPKFDPRRIVASSSLDNFALALEGKGTRAGGAIVGRASINDEPIAISSLRFTMDRRKFVLDALNATLGDARGVLSASGNLDFGEAARGRLDVDWSDIRLPKSWVGQDLDTHGHLQLGGSPADYTANGALALGPPGRAADISLDAIGSSDAITLRRLRIAQPNGAFDASGEIAWRPRLSWKLAARASDFDPGELFVAWKGRLDLACDFDGRTTDAGISASLRVRNLSGTLRGRQLAGGGALAFTSPALLTGDLRLTSDRSAIEFHGSGQRASVVLDIESLADWLPNGSGALRARATAKGKWPALAIAGNARGAHLRLGAASAETINLAADVRDPLHPSGSMRVRANTIAASGFEIHALNAEVEGTERSHRIDISVNGKPLSTSLRLQGARTEQGWTGTLERWVLDVDEVNRFALRAPADIKVAADGQSVSEVCLDSRDGQLCASGERNVSGALDFQYTMREVPLRLVSVVAPTLPISVRGAINGEGKAARAMDGTWTGNATLQSTAGELARAVSDGAPSSALLTYQDFRAHASLDGSEARARIDARLDRSGTLQASLQASDLQSAAIPVQGEVRASLPSLAALSLLTPQLAQANGRAELHAAIAGVASAPKIEGELHVNRFAAQLPALGVQLKDGVVEAKSRDGGTIDLSASLKSGDGYINVRGDWTTQNELHVAIEGEKFLLADIPSAHVVAAPNLTMSRTNRQFQLEGRVVVTDAAINIQKLPRGTKPPRASSDVIVVDARKTGEQSTESAPLAARITVSFGEDVKVEGYGLNATVTGQLQVHEQPGEVTRGAGEIKIAGTYKAYGQDLTIERGNVLYADAPLSNPQLDITAIRKIEDVTAGLRIAGSAQNPQLSVYSDPAMGEANALSYLVAGKPLDAIGTGEDDGSALQSAARSLGTAGGGLLAKKLGARFGISEVSVKENELIGGAAFTVGEYLSPRLFLSYGVGLFEPGEVVTLRYRLSDNWSVQTERGSEETRAGLQFRAEK